MDNSSDNTPDTGTVESEAMGDPMDRLAEILEDPETDTPEDEVDAEDSEDADDVEAEAETDDDETEDSEDSEEDAEEEDDEPQATGGRFVEHSARVKLSDGTTTTVEELSKSYFRQSDYTRKSQENATEREAIKAEREKVSQTFQDLQQRHDVMSAMLEQWKPQRPQSTPQDDPLAWMEYRENVAGFEEWQSSVKQQLEQAKTAEMQELQKVQAEQHAEQRAKLLEKIPALADKDKATAFLDAAKKTMAEYGFTPEEVDGLPDYRFAVVMRDLMRMKRMMAKAPSTKDDIRKKPKMLKNARRGDAPQKTARKAKFDRLRETGKVTDAVAVLNSLDL